MIYHRKYPFFTFDFDLEITRKAYKVGYSSCYKCMDPQSLKLQRPTVQEMQLHEI